MKLFIFLVLFSFSGLLHAQILFGAWVESGSIKAVNEFENQLGKPLSIVHRFYAWNDPIPTDLEEHDKKKGKANLVTWEPYGTTLDEIISGKEDQFIIERARAFKMFKQKIFLRFAHEMNGNWYPWGGQPKKFKEAFRRVHDLFKEEGADNVLWVWCPNIMSVPNESWNDMEAYYPGDAFVDWIAADGYNWGTTASYFRWQSFEEIFSDFHRRYGGRKPLMIAETSSTEVGGNKALWIKEMKESLSRFPHLKALIWFQEKKETDWRANSSDSSFKAFKNLLSY